MTTVTTNLDNLELSIPSIEADEINSGSAIAGQVLTADGAGGARWLSAIPFLGDISDNGLRPTEATTEAAFVAVTERPSRLGDVAVALDSSGELAPILVLLRLSLNLADLIWMAISVSLVDI